ncbi:MAG: efflux RND transporter periplasmic adaptor subunit [Saprospirales bacterium]|nr:MAG: efflux RND transporter periplasmic adaptor subunit [Saprospirales bacterium]
MKKREIIIALIALALGAGLVYFMMPSPDHEHPTETAPKNGSEESTIYTCSMHPQVERDEPGICPICEMDLVPKSAVESDDPHLLQMTENAVRLSQLETSEALPVGVDGGETISFSGKMREDRDRSARLITYVPGEIINLNVKYEGQRVRKGQHMADIFSPELRLQQEELIQAHKRRDESPGLYRATRRKLDNWRMDSSLVEKIIETGHALDILPVYATASGTVRTLNVSEGDMVSRGASLGRVADLSSLWAEFEVPETDLDQVRIGSELTFTTLSVPGHQFSATVYYIDPQVDPVKRTVIARARVSAEQRLKPEMLIRAYLYSDQSEEEALVQIPASAVLWTGPRSVVWVKVPDRDIPSFEYREVVLQRLSTRRAIIKEGLEVGEQVVSQGAFVIDAAAQLNNQRSMMNRLVGEDGVHVHRESINPHHNEAAVAFIQEYLRVKAALVESHAEDARYMTRALGEKLENIPGTIDDSSIRDNWMRWHERAVEAIQTLAESDDISIQREAFENISRALIYWLRHFEIDTDALYLQHCPMAFDNEGADWISTEEEILNPYFGDQMLHCGLVEEVFQ